MVEPEVGVGEEGGRSPCEQTPEGPRAVAGQASHNERRRGGALVSEREYFRGQGWEGSFRAQNSMGFL